MYPNVNQYPGNYPGVYQPFQTMQNQTIGQPLPQSQNPGQSGYVCRPVTSREEAIASQVDFLGLGSIMPDFSHGMIYFKRFNPNSGSAEFYAFSLQPLAQPPAQQSEPATPAYDPRQDINALRDDVTAMREELDEMKKASQKRTSGKGAEA